MKAFFIFFHQKYLKDYYFQNAKTANFWASLANVCLNFFGLKSSIARLIPQLSKKAFNMLRRLIVCLDESEVKG